MKLFLALLLSIPVNASDKEYLNKLGNFYQDTALSTTVLPEVIKWAIDEELLGKTDTEFFNQYLGIEFYINNCRVLRERYEDLHDVPYAADALRFPPYERVNELLAFNNEYQSHLAAQQLINISRRDQYSFLLQENKKLHDIWANVAESRHDWLDEWQRRYSLKFVLEAIGPADYYAGKLPPHIPVWRFSKLD